MGGEDFAGSWGLSNQKQSGEKSDFDASEL